MVLFGQSGSSDPYQRFDNCYNVEPFIFVVPENIRVEGYPDKVYCGNVEKAMQCCKAMLARDGEAFEEIRGMMSGASAKIR